MLPSACSESGLRRPGTMQSPISVSQLFGPTQTNIFAADHISASATFALRQIQIGRSRS